LKHLYLFLLLSLFTAPAIAQTEKNLVDNNKAVKNIILLIGDGMGTTQIYAGITVSPEKLNIERFKIAGFSKTYSASDYITDSGAGGTAIATGFKTYNKAIGLDLDTIPRKSILEYSENHNKATGLVVSSQVTHATPASFIAHQKERYLYEEIAEDFLKTDIDVFIGGGRDHFTKRKDSVDLTVELKNKGYQIVFEENELNEVNEGKLAALLYDNKPPRYSDGRGEMLPNATKKALEILSKDEDGFFLVVEGSQIDWGGHANNTDYVVEEMLDFDKAIGIALDFAEKDRNTLVIVTADHETGGMGINNGDLNTGELSAKYTSLNHTGVMVPVFAYGPEAIQFGGIQENTDLFYKMMKAFNFNIQ
jgi:alkaline phosphatase